MPHSTARHVALYLLWEQIEQQNAAQYCARAQCEWVMQRGAELPSLCKARDPWILIIARISMEVDKVTLRCQRGGGKITPILFSPAHLWNRERYNGVLLWLFLHMVPLRNAIQTTSETVHVYHSCTHDERVTDVAMCTQYVFRNSSTSTTNTKYILRVHRYISN